MKYLKIIEFDKYPFLKSVFTLKEIDASKVEDREIICIENNFSISNLTYNKQTHGDTVNVVNIQDVGIIREGDAIITDLKNVPLFLFVADCVSIGIVDVNKKVIGIAHAGWKGTYKRIVQRLLESFIKEFKSDINHLRVFISPSIGVCCYEVNEELYRDFEKQFKDLKIEVGKIEQNKYYLDLKHINEEILKSCGVLKANIENNNLCTYCNEKLFHSYRKNNKTDKRMALIMELTED